MKLYAEVPRWRLRQLLSDAAVLVWVYVWVRVGQEIHELVLRLQGAGRSLEDTGGDFAGRFDDISQTVDRVPLVGGQLRRPFGAVATRPLYELQRACADPAAALATADYAPLAALELGAMGLRADPQPPQIGASRVE